LTVDTSSDGVCAYATKLAKPTNAPDLSSTLLMNSIASWIWVLIPLAAIGIAPFKMWIKVKEKQIEAQTSLAAEKSAQYAAHVERIEARLRVLEQIVTDRGVETAAQIEALRDKPRLDSGEKVR